MNQPLKYEILGYPGGVANIEFGLNFFNFHGTYDDNLHYQGCRPFILNCIVKIYLLVCLPRFNEEDTENINELKILSKFRSLTKNNFTIGRFFDEMKSVDAYQCQTQIKIISSNLTSQKAFYKDPVATFTTKSLHFENKIILAGAIFKGDNQLELMGECSIFKSNIKKDQLINCFNSSISQIIEPELSFELLRYWSIWAIVNCAYLTKDETCAPLCKITSRNLCGANGEECIKDYSKVPVEVMYTTKKLKKENKYIKMSMENRCLYNNPCLKKVCGSKTCYTIENGTSTCASFSLSVVNEMTKTKLFINYVQSGDILKCILIPYDEGGEKVIKLNPVIKWVLEQEDNDITIKEDLLFINTENIKKRINASCIAEFSKYSPPYQVSFQFKLYKFPINVSMNIDSSGYVHTNQRIYCKSDGYPRKYIQYQYNVSTNNFNLNKIMKNSEYLQIPLNAKLGALTISCQAKMKIGGKEVFKTGQNHYLTLIKIQNLHWGSENRIIYPEDIITCSAITLLSNQIEIIQLDGPSYLIPINKISYKISSNLKGGQYSVLCTINILDNTNSKYYRKYTFQLFKKPKYLCLYSKPGFKKIIIKCLHDGFPQDRALTNVRLKKSIRNQIVSLKNGTNKIIIFFENESFDYELICSSKYENITLISNTSFGLQDQSGVFMKRYDNVLKMCSSEMDENNIIGKDDKFWLIYPKGLSFFEVKICLIFLILSNMLSIVFILIHMYSLDKCVALGLTVSSLSRRHCIMRLYRKLNEVALFRLKNAEFEETSKLRVKFEAYRSTEDHKD